MSKQVKQYPTSKVGDLRSVNVSANIAGLDVDLVEFEAWLSVEIGKYDVTNALVRELRPKLADEKRELKALTKVLRETGARTKPSSIPPGVRAALKTVSTDNDHAWRDACTAVDEAISNLLEMLEQAEDIVNEKPSKRGRPSRCLRNELLETVVAKLKQCGATVAGARERAEAILIACHIPTPSGDRNIRRATNRFKRAGGI